MGCWREAQRADKVAAHLVRIRNTLTTEFFEHITAVLKEIESSSRLLRDLYDLFPIYRSRVPMIVYYLNIILPSYCKTLQQMTVYVDNDGLSARSQWVLMYERMGEQGGMTLAARFVMFVDFLVQVRIPRIAYIHLEMLKIADGSAIKQVRKVIPPLIGLI